jgi:tetratricopeptide (TPR) repeat protein
MLDEWLTTSSQALAAIEAGQAQRDRSLPYPFDGVFDAAGWHAAQRRVEDEIHFLLAIGLGNLAMSYASLSNLGSAEKAMWQALDYSLLAADLRALAGAWFAYGIIQLQADEPPSSILWYLLVAESAAVAGGNLDNAFAAAIMRGRVLMAGGEYHQAAECFERAGQRATLSARRELKIEGLASKAALACRRHELATSLDLFDQALVLAEGVSDASARVRWQRLQSFCNEPQMRDMLLADCDELLQQVRAGLDPDPMSGLPDASMIARMKVHLTEVRELMPPPFVVMDDSLEAMPHAARLRQLLVNCEYFRDRGGVAMLLKQMTELKLQAGDDNPRAEELATAYARAAETVDGRSQLDARILFSQAAFRLGDLTRARKALKGLESIDFAYDPELEQRKRGWLLELNTASPRPIHHYLLIRNLAEGLAALRFSARDRQQTAASLAKVAPVAAQVVICQLAQEYRDAGDHAGVASCYSLLARSAVAAGRQALATDLDRIAAELRLLEGTGDGASRRRRPRLR